MPKLKTAITNFSTGQITPSMESRIDLAKYQNALRTADNVVLLSQGGITKRSGTKVLHTSDITKDFFTCYLYKNTDTKYMIIINTKGDILVFNKNGLVQKIVNAIKDTIVPKDMDYTQYGDSIIIVSNHFLPKKLIKNGASFELHTIEPKGHPFLITKQLKQLKYEVLTQYNYGGISPVVSNTSNWKEPDRFLLKATFPIRVFSYTKSLGRKEYKEDEDFTIDYVAKSFKFKTDTTDETRNDLYIYYGDNIYQTHTNSHGFIEPLTNDLPTTYQLGKSVGLDKPSSVTLFQGRVVYGGYKDIPNLVIYTEVNTIDGYDTQFGDMTGAFFDVIATGKFNKIKKITSGRKLVFFTEEEEIIQVDDVLSAKTTSYQVISANGLAKGQPIISDESIFYIAQDRTIKQITYDETIAGYSTIDITLLTSLVKNPIDIGVGINKHLHSKYIYVTNKDGTIAVLNYIKAENIAGWTRFKFKDRIAKGVQSVGSDTYLITKSINGDYILEIFDNTIALDKGIIKTQYGHYVGDGEKRIFSVPNTGIAPYEIMNNYGFIYKRGVDFSVGRNRAVTFNNPPEIGERLYYLSESIVINTYDFTIREDMRNMKLDVIAGVNAQEQVSTITGDLKIKTKNIVVQIGVPIEIEVETIPLVAMTQVGDTRNQKKRLYKAELTLRNTGALLVNGKRLHDKKYPIPFNHTTNLSTRIRAVKFLGYNKDTTINIKQTDPFMFQMDSLEAFIKV